MKLANGILWLPEHVSLPGNYAADATTKVVAVAYHFLSSERNLCRDVGVHRSETSDFIK